MNAAPSSHVRIERTRFERRDERTQQEWLNEVHTQRNPLRFDRRDGPRRGDEIADAQVADIECGGTGRVSVAERNPTLNVRIANILQAFGA